MADKIPGGLSIANEVIADLVGHVALECYGVVGMAAPTLQDGVAKLLPKQRLRRGIQVESGEKGARIDLYVVIEFGTNIATVCKNLRDQVAFTLKDYADLPIESIEIHVMDVKVRD